MLATIWLLGLVLGTAQSSARPAPTTPPAVARADWVGPPRLVRGQELVYRGTFDELASGSRVQFQRAYRFEARYFVLETPSRGVELAALTALREKTPASNTPPASSAVNLSKLLLTAAGKVTPEPGSSVAVPLEGAPSIEIGAFLELPRARPAVGKGWDVSETGRPVFAWRVTGTETLGTGSCIKFVGVQQSEDWDRPRADRSAWRREETVWISPRTGIAARVERVLEQREPARREVARRSVLRYELESDLSYPGRLADDRRGEIAHAFAFRDAARPLLAEPGKNARQITTLQKRIALHIDNEPPTPYRDAVQLVRRQVEAAERGEVVPVVHHETARVPTTARVGDVAPDFVATEITGTGSARLAKWKGKAVVLVFYHPGSFTAGELLRFAQEIHTSLGKHVQVVGLSVSDDAAAVLKQRTAMKLGFPILHGGGLRISYGVETTPRLVVIDPTGVVRGAYTGWGSETSGEVMTELRRWLPGQ